MHNISYSGLVFVANNNLEVFPFELPIFTSGLATKENLKQGGGPLDQVSKGNNPATTHTSKLGAIWCPANIQNRAPRRLHHVIGPLDNRITLYWMVTPYSTYSKFVTEPQSIERAHSKQLSRGVPRYHSNHLVVWSAREQLPAVTIPHLAGSRKSFRCLNKASLP
jgi:hypothetical protein